MCKALCQTNFPCQTLSLGKPECEPTDDPCPKGDKNNKDIHIRIIENKALEPASRLTYVGHAALRVAGWEQKGSSAGVCVGVQYQVCLRQHPSSFVWLRMRVCDRGPVGP